MIDRGAWTSTLAVCAALAAVVPSGLGDDGGDKHATVAEADIDGFTYACHDTTPSQWCWEAAPKPLTVTLP